MCGKSPKATPASKGGARSNPLVPDSKGLFFPHHCPPCLLWGQFYTSVPQHHPDTDPGWQTGRSGEGDLESDCEQQPQEGTHIPSALGPAHQTAEGQGHGSCVQSCTSLWGQGSNPFNLQCLSCYIRSSWRVRMLVTSCHSNLVTAAAVSD